MQATAAIPDNVTFTLEKLGKWENLTEINVGSKVEFQLTVHFPAGVTEVLIELFTPDNASIIMSLCDVTVKAIGSNLQAAPNAINTVEAVLESKDKSTNVIIDFLFPVLQMQNQCKGVLKYRLRANIRLYSSTYLQQ